MTLTYKATDYEVTGEVYAMDDNGDVSYCLSFIKRETPNGDVIDSVSFPVVDGQVQLGDYKLSN